MYINKVNISLNQISKLENLSVQSYNICKKNNLTDISAIINFYLDNGSFLHLRNCGQVSNIELVNICHKYKNLTTKIIESNPENNIQQQIDNLTVKQKKILDNVIDSLVNNLSIRSFNCIKYYAESDYSLDNLTEIIINPYFNLKTIRNVGRVSEKELNSLFINIREQIEIIQSYEDYKEVSVELFKTYLNKRFNNLKPEINHDILEDYDIEIGLPIFKTIQTLISNDLIFNKKEKLIFQKGLNFWMHTEISKIKKIGSSLNLTTERIREIRKHLIENLNNTFSFIKGLEFETLNLYDIDIDSDIIIINEDLVKEINRQESTSFNQIFITKILSILLDNTHCLVGNIMSCACNIKDRETKYKWHSVYLVKKELTEMIDFSSLIIDVSRRLSGKIEENYSLDFETHLINFKKPGSSIDFKRVIPVAEHILFNELEITNVLFNDRINFERNTKKLIYEYAYEALKELGEPSKVDTIYKKVKELYPGYITSVEKLRTSMQRSSKFVPLGRSSTYGLKIWEGKIESFKGGTIRNIVEQFLKKHNKPKHLLEVTEYVNKFRNTNGKNIITNLKLDKSNVFVFFPQNFIGLQNKKDSVEYRDYYYLPKNFGIYIKQFIRKEKMVSEKKLLNYFGSKVYIDKSDISLIIRQLSLDGCIKIENSNITLYKKIKR